MLGLWLQEENRTFFKDFNCSKRKDTEEKFRLNCILKNIPDMQFVTKIPLDYMHLVCLGCMKTLLRLWTAGKPTGLGKSVIETINERI